MVYSHMDDRGRTVSIGAVTPALGGGLHVTANPRGVDIPDDEIPRLISKLQNYMSQRAREMVKAAGK